MLGERGPTRGGASNAPLKAFNHRSMATASQRRANSGARRVGFWGGRGFFGLPAVKSSHNRYSPTNSPASISVAMVVGGLLVHDGLRTVVLGQVSCGSWTKARQSRAVEHIYWEWFLAGFPSGVNMVNSIDALRGVRDLIVLPLGSTTTVATTLSRAFLTLPCIS